MDDDERARIAREGLDAIEQIDPGAIRARVDQAARKAAGDAVLGGIAAVGRLTGAAPRRPRTGPSDELVESTLAAMEARNVAAFDARLAEAVERAGGAPAPAAPAEPAAEAEPWLDTAELRELARLRRSFPAEARELAILVFACSDLLEDLAERDQPPSAEELAKKEALIARIGALLAPRAGAALTSFVGHVTDLSRRHRAAR